MVQFKLKITVIIHCKLFLGNILGSWGSVYALLFIWICLCAHKGSSKRGASKISCLCSLLLSLHGGERWEQEDVAVVSDPCKFSEKWSSVNKDISSTSWNEEDPLLDPVYFCRNCPHPLCSELGLWQAEGVSHLIKQRDTDVCITYIVNIMCI